jgi:hypothetical protein
MKKLSIILLGLLASGTFLFAQEENKVEKVRPYPMSYEQRVERGFGQVFEPLWAGDRPAWIRREESNRQTQRVEITVTHRGPMNRGEFRQGRGPMGPRGPMMHQRGMQFRKEMQLCPQCQNHMPKKHVRGGDRPQGRQHRGGR